MQTKLHEGWIEVNEDFAPKPVRSKVSNFPPLTYLSVCLDPIPANGSLKVWRKYRDSEVGSGEILLKEDIDYNIDDVTGEFSFQVMYGDYWRWEWRGK